MNMQSQIIRLGRPKDSSKHDEIILAATELFLEKGFDLTSMDEVARRAGVSKLTVYSHFSDKRDLFRAIMQYRFDKMGMPTSFAPFFAVDPRAALTDIATDLTTKIYRPDTLKLMRVVQAAAAHHADIVQAFYDKGPGRVKSAFAELLGHYHHAQKLIVPDAMKASEQFFSLLKGEFLQQRLMLMMPSPNRAALQKHVEQSVAFFLAAHLPETSS